MRDFLIPYFLNILYEDFHVLGCMFTTTILDSEFSETLIKTDFLFRIFLDN